MCGQDGKSCHRAYILAGFRGWSTSSIAQTIFSELTLKGFHDLDRIPRSVTVTSLKPVSASAGCYGPKVIIMAVVVLPQRKLGKVIRWSIRVYWMAGCYPYTIGTVKIPVDRLIMELYNPCHLGDYHRKLPRRSNGMCWWPIIFLRLTGHRLTHTGPLRLPWVTGKSLWNFYTAIIICRSR